MSTQDIHLRARRFLVLTALAWVMPAGPAVACSQADPLPVDMMMAVAKQAVVARVRSVELVDLPTREHDRLEFGRVRRVQLLVEELLRGSDPSPLSINLPYPRLPSGDPLPGCTGPLGQPSPGVGEQLLLVAGPTRTWSWVNLSGERGKQYLAAWRGNKTP